MSWMEWPAVPHNQRLETVQRPTNHRTRGSSIDFLPRPAMWRRGEGGVLPFFLYTAVYAIADLKFWHSLFTLAASFYSPLKLSVLWVMEGLVPYKSIGSSYRHLKFLYKGMIKYLLNKNEEKKIDGCTTMVSNFTMTSLTRRAPYRRSLSNTTR